MLIYNYNMDKCHFSMKLKYEITHAFLAESGLRGNCDWADNEEMVDWIAIQLPKMYKACVEAHAIEEGD